MVVVTGSGRSGTSTIAGTLKLLGLSIPQPEVKADATNPRGFFEPRWVVNFHKRILLSAGVATLDGRPNAPEKTQAVGAQPGVRRELHEWLEQAVEPQFVVKDPRTFWLNDLWRETAESVGVQMSLITMLRHPTEVVGSRDAYYTKNQTAAQRKSRETGLLAGWVNVCLVNERASRGERRVFVHYENLLTDWRREMLRVSSVLDLELNADLTSSEPHPVDDFIDVSLHRVRLTWDDLDVPGPLRDLAENVWQCLAELATPDADHADVSARMDRYREEYDAMYEYSKALVHDATVARIRRVRINTRRQVEQELAQAAPAPSGLPRRAARKARDWWHSRFGG
jgi:hypothetical protein